MQTSILGSMPRQKSVPEIAAIVVNWNGGALAVESVRSVAEQSLRPSLWVVDNASTDGSADAIATACPDAHLIRNQQNLGFAAGNNQAWQEAAGADYLLLVNNDVILPDPDALREVVSFLEGQPDTHGVCGRYEYPDGEFQHFYNQLPTAFDLMVSWGIGKHWPPFLRSRRTRAYHLQKHDFNRASTIEQPAFACVLLRGSSARQVGMFDERFPIFFNDIDYCWRWRERGWTWHYLPQWRIIHHRSRSTARLGAFLQAELAGSAVRFARKHFPPLVAESVCASVVLEAAWRKLRHDDFPRSLTDLWHGHLPFCPPLPQPPA